MLHWGTFPKMNCAAGEYLYADRKPHNRNCLVLCQRQTKRFTLKNLTFIFFQHNDGFAILVEGKAGFGVCAVMCSCFNV